MSEMEDIEDTEFDEKITHVHVDLSELDRVQSRTDRQARHVGGAVGCRLGSRG